MRGGLMINNRQHPVGLILWCALLEEYSILCVFTEGAVDSDVHLSTLRGKFLCFMMEYCSPGSNIVTSHPTLEIS
jgi:hypothetical protein